jgi:hypothetical protein
VPQGIRVGRRAAGWPQRLHTEPDPARRAHPGLGVTHPEFFLQRLAPVPRQHEAEQAFGRERLAGEGIRERPRLAVRAGADDGPERSVGVDHAAVARGNLDALAGLLDGSAQQGQLIGRVADLDMARREAEQKECSDHGKDGQNGEHQGFRGPA